MIDYKFNIGDMVITYIGQMGTIVARDACEDFDGYDEYCGPIIRYQKYYDVQFEDGIICNFNERKLRMK